MYSTRKKLLMALALGVVLICVTFFPGISEAATYIVKKGDSLWSIASQNKISMDKLLKLNNIDDTIIYPGQVLKVDDEPAPQQSSSNPAPVSNPEPAPNPSDSANIGTYIVKKGDTLWAIARRHNTTVEELQRLNNINGQLLHPGQMLKISGQAPESLPSRSGSPREGIVPTALRFVGTSYARGGRSPAGFDCSGFAKYVYSLNGITIPNTAASQANTGTKVPSISQLQPGDLVCFSNGRNGHIDHVGIYAGNNKIIHASSSRRSIIEASLNDGWFQQRFVCGVRVL